MATILFPPARVRNVVPPGAAPFFTLASIRRALRLSPGARLEVITVRHLRPRIPTYEVLIARPPRAAAHLPVNHRACRILAEAHPGAPFVHVRGPVWHGRVVRERVHPRARVTAYA